jgi:hypothetical protein
MHDLLLAREADHPLRVAWDDSDPLIANLS